MKFATRVASDALPEGAAICRLNDTFRQTLTGGLVVLTPGVRDLGAADQAAVLAKVQTYDAFDPEDDPYQEHDFGAFDHAGIKCAWKIDCYSPGMEKLSEDAADEARIVRVLTIMRADEF